MENLDKNFKTRAKFRKNFVKNFGNPLFIFLKYFCCNFLTNFWILQLKLETNKWIHKEFWKINEKIQKKFGIILEKISHTCKENLKNRKENFMNVVKEFGRNSIIVFRKYKELWKNNYEIIGKTLKQLPEILTNHNWINLNMYLISDILK